ncbi:BhlA/UviB family holin-like peptide [Alkaliphilus transvaalensis]|uniref:BhlA/UviB family holin-like peptide n=1 Tax=Alkaliphilus transvaalensis TaxID=114628 RepID=UPI000478894A|nr:BhlA/UviB family holin-like peptide [Alkaliphilus transvaalensis]
MENELLKLASSQGVWAVLSVVLILYILKNQEKRDVKQDQRELNYQSIIQTLTDKLNVIEAVKKDVEDVKNFILNRDQQP